MTHIFAEYGSKTISAVAHSSQGDVNSNNQSVTVDDAALTVTKLVSASPDSNSAVPVATLTDAAGISSNPSDLSAAINWGDGS